MSEKEVSYEQLEETEAVVRSAIIDSRSTCSVRHSLAPAIISGSPKNGAAYKIIKMTDAAVIPRYNSKGNFRKRIAVMIQFITLKMPAINVKPRSHFALVSP